MSNEREQIDNLVKRTRKQAKHINDLQAALGRYQRRLDGLHWVWCDGGCKTGVHRYTDDEIDESTVEEVERNAVRLRTWFMNRKARNIMAEGIPIPERQHLEGRCQPPSEEHGNDHWICPPDCPIEALGV